MSQDISNYITEVSDKYKTGRAGEHAYRPTFEKLIKSIDQKIGIINDPKRTEHGAPDFIFVRGDLIAGYVETKDIDADLDKVEKTEQVERYLGYSNLILTNYLEFRFFRNGERYGEPIIAGKIINGAVQVQEDQIDSLENAIGDFISAKPEAIKSGIRLAKIMGGKARRVRDNVRQFLSVKSEGNKELEKIYETIKRLLVHDLTLESFADMYAQTLVYGLFVARYYDDSPEDFTRQEARDLIPASNPFLRHFFDHIAGPDFDKRLAYIVNELCEVFSLADVNDLMSQYFKQDGLWGKIQKGPDPVIHFYEDFLKEYDSGLRKKMGAFYTPLPVVSFIVRSVDYLLKKEFNLSEGLADASKTGTTHKVQILDPAVGTGTFISEVIRTIYQNFSGQEGRWPTYVFHDLLPRLYGFELMMAPYTIAHLKFSMMLKETGFKHFNNSRLGIFLTNSLEQGIENENSLFSFGLAQSIAEEAKEASVIKNEKPIMVVVGNPPYSVSSSNKGEWILNLIKDYKKDLGERKINLDDDYIKFIRFAEHFIEKNENGIVAMITNNSFIDGITHRQMRKHLLETFDDIYVLNLHGNSKKKEKCPDGGKDENVFDIQQGVSISIFIRKESKKTGLGKVFYSELYGKREDKFDKLNSFDLEKMKWQELNAVEPYYFFVPKDFGDEEEYKNGFSVTEIFNEYNSGIQTKRDDTTIQFTKEEIENVVGDFQNLPEEEIRTKYQLPKDGRDWKIEWAKKDIQNGFEIEPILYRPFDTRMTVYTGKSKGFLAYPREKTNINIVGKNNITFLTSRQIPTNHNFDRAFITKNISDIHAASDQTYVFPLYLYTENGTKMPNFKKEIISDIEKIIGKTTPEDILDYIYAVLYSPNYREKYKEFLKIDFPRVPYPKDRESFNKLTGFGKELRELHLLESPKLKNFVTTFPESGSDTIEPKYPKYKDGNVYINDVQYLGGVPEIAWNFYIGGYQPAQKWLKDRKGRKLSNEDIEHYQKMIVALTETDRVMGEIDKVLI